MARKKIILDKLSKEEREIYEEFVESCTLAREQYGYSQEEAAVHMKVSRNTYNSFETIRSVPLKVRLIARHYGIKFPSEIAK